MGWIVFSKFWGLKIKKYLKSPPRYTVDGEKSCTTWDAPKEWVYGYHPLNKINYTLDVVDVVVMFKNPYLHFWYVV